MSSTLVAVKKAFRNERFRSNRTFDDEDIEDAFAGSPEDIAGHIVVDQDRGYTGRGQGQGQGRASEIQGSDTQNMSDTARARRMGLGRKEYQDWQNSNWQLAAGKDPMAHLQQYPDIALKPDDVPEGLFRQPLTHDLSSVMGIDPEDMDRVDSRWQKPLMQKKAFDYALELLESRYFG